MVKINWKYALKKGLFAAVIFVTILFLINYFMEDPLDKKDWKYYATLFVMIFIIQYFGVYFESYKKEKKFQSYKKK